jgi:hypothetical protein
VCFVCDDPNPTTAVSGILAREWELGGYKHEYSLPVTAEMVELANSLGPKNVGPLRKYFDEVLDALEGVQSGQ